MRKSLFILLAGAVLALGALSDANASSLQFIGHAKGDMKYTPIENVACRGWGRWCGPGHTRICRHGRCWCRPC